MMTFHPGALLKIQKEESALFARRLEEKGSDPNDKNVSFRRRTATDA
jgi:hypothetical protein